MAAAPKYKVYTANGSYVAACKHVEDAAAIIAIYGDGATIRVGHDKKWIAWTEGEDGHAGESFDAVADLVFRRDHKDSSYFYRKAAFDHA